MEYTPYLVHYGVKGMKWGVRRYQNKDGTLTTAGKKRNSSSSKSSDADKEKRRSTAKKVAATTAAVVTVAAAATIYAKNPKVRDTVNSVVSKVSKESVSKISKEAVNRGKAYAKKALGEAYSGAKAGVKEGVHEGAKKVAKTVVTGVMLNTAKRALDASIGREEATRIFQANNNKKISSFWKVSAEDKDEDD